MHDFSAPCECGRVRKCKIVLGGKIMEEVRVLSTRGQCYPIMERWREKVRGL